MRMKKNSQYLLFAIIVVFFFDFGCKNSNPLNASEQKNNVIWPLAIGNRWNYQLDYYDTLGNYQRSYYDTMMITSDTVISNETWYNGIYGSCTNRIDGFYTHSLGANPSLMFKYPVSVGDSIPFGTYNYIKFLSHIDTIVVNDQVYSTYRYDGRYQDSTGRNVAYNRFYLVPNLGMVQQEYYAPSLDRVLIRAWLLSYSLY